MRCILLSCPATRLIAFGAIGIALATHARSLADVVQDKWEGTIRQSAFVKEGLDRVRNPRYQYECLGLGGTVLRTGIDGLGMAVPCVTNLPGQIQHLPYLSYQYWWDDAGHRHLPFELNGAYGLDVSAAALSEFSHTLDIAKGCLSMDLAFNLRPVSNSKSHRTADSRMLRTHREMFVTPDGVLVLRVKDASDNPSPFKLKVGINKDVRIYLNHGFYAGPHAPWSGTAQQRGDGIVITAVRPNSCMATLAIACDGPDIVSNESELAIGSGLPGKTVTFYIAPGSSYESPDPGSVAWSKAQEARSRGFAALRRNTARWWDDFYSKSSVSLPDSELAKWLARSTYYLGVYFGDTDIPPGCNGTSIELFAGAICPEYDMVLNQMGLLYGNHLDEAKRVVRWIERTMPSAERYATNGLNLHGASVKYSGGAKFGPLIGYDGTFVIPPTKGESVWAYEDFCGNNMALMATRYADWTGDTQAMAAANRVLKQTTIVSVEDLYLDTNQGAMVNRFMPATMQQAGTLFALRECVRRGVADPGWTEMSSKMLLPTAILEGKKVFCVGPGAVVENGAGDATWLSPAWWYGVTTMESDIVRDSYEAFRHSKTGNYVFNNGWMGVIAARLGLGNEAASWARRLLVPDRTAFDDTCFGEIVADGQDFKKTPEVAAHSAFVCNILQMLLNGDDDKTLDVFPALPEKWELQGVSFQNLAASENLLVTGELATNRIRVVVENRGDTATTRQLRVRIPNGGGRLKADTPGSRRDNGWIVIPNLRLEPKGKKDITFSPEKN